MTYNYLAKECVGYRIHVTIISNDALHWQFSGLVVSEANLVCIGDDANYGGPLSVEDVQNIRVSGSLVDNWRLSNLQLAVCVKH